MDLESSNQSVWSGEGCLPEENRKRIKKLIVELMYMSVWRDILQFCQSQEWISSRHTENYQFSSVAQSCPTLCDPMGCSTPGFPVHHQLPELTVMSIESVMPFNHFILCRPLLFLPSIFPNIRVFSNESVLHIRWPVTWQGREANNSLKTNVGLCKCFSAIKLKNHREVMKYLGFTVINTWKYFFMW